MTTKRFLLNCIAGVCSGLGLLHLSGCAVMREDSAPLAQLSSDQIRLADDIKLAQEGWPEAAWWTRYHDQQLDELIRQSLKASPTLEVARTRIAASEAQAELVNAASGPFVGAAAEVDRQSVSENGFLGAYGKTIPMLGTNGPWYTEARVGARASYDLDLWGKDHAKTQAALGFVNARKAEAAQVELLLASNVAQVYFDLQLLNEKEGLLREMHAVRVRIAEAHQARADHGLEPVSATQLAQIQMLELDKQLAAAASQRHILRESLRFLIGADATGLRELAPVELQERQPALPSSLGFELLAHRPDLQALRWYVQSSMDQISAAKAAFYPSFDIRAFAGFDSLHTNELLHRSSRQLNLIPGMSLPLFDSGRLNAGLAATRSQSNALIAQYNEAVLQAVREVAQRSIDLDGLRQRSDLQTQKVHAAEFVARSAEACHQRGLIDSAISGESSLPWLAERTFALELHGACLHAEVALIATLGGGYEVMPKRQKIAVAKPENSAR